MTTILTVLFGLTAMLALLGVAAWLWFLDPPWPWTATTIAPEPWPPVAVATPAEPPPAAPAGQRATGSTAVFREPEPNSDRTQILPDNVMLEQMTAHPQHSKASPLVLVDGHGPTPNPHPPASSPLDARRSS